MQWVFQFPLCVYNFKHGQFLNSVPLLGLDESLGISCYISSSVALVPILSGELVFYPSLNFC